MTTFNGAMARVCSLQVVSNKHFLRNHGIIQSINLGSVIPARTSSSRIYALILLSQLSRALSSVESKIVESVAKLKRI